MTVDELIKELKQHDPTCEVIGIEVDSMGHSQNGPIDTLGRGREVVNVTRARQGKVVLIDLSNEELDHEALLRRTGDM